MVVVAAVSPSSGGNVLANSSSVCQFLVTDEQRATASSARTMVVDAREGCGRAPGERPQPQGTSANLRDGVNRFQ